MPERLSSSRLSPGSVLGAMVEVGSLLTAVPGLCDLTQEDALKQTYFYPARDSTRPPSARILRSSARCFPLSRLAPKPFSKEQDLDGREPGPPKPGPSGGPKTAPAGQDGRMPSLAGQESDSGEVSPSQALGLRHTVAIFETHRAGSMVGTGAGERSPAASAGVPRDPPGGPRPQVAAKPVLPTRKLPGTLPRPASLSPDTRSTAPPQEEEEGGGQARPLPKASSVEDPGGHTPGPRLRSKRRPMSAIFPETMPPPGPGSGGKPAPAPPEKTWVRKPRPLSVDLTAPFESREVLLRQAAMEGAGAECWGAGGVRPEPPAARAAPARPDLDADFREVAKKIQERKEKLRLKYGEEGSPRAPGPSTRAQSPEEAQGPLDPEPEKVPESPPARPGQGRGPALEREASPGPGWMSKGSVKKRLSLFGEDRALALAIGSESTTVTPETPVAALELDKAGVSVQARIKGWAAESAGEKVEIRKRALQVRPRSEDLTRVFSSSAPSGEIRYEKCAVLGGALAEEQREKQKQGCNMDDIPTPRSPWKPGGPQTASRQTERQASCSQDTDSPGQAPQLTPEGEGSFQTVWATMFEHRVERHSVADQGTPLSAPDLLGEAHACASGPRARPERGSCLGKDLLAGRATLSDSVSAQGPVPASEKPATRDSSSRAALPWTQRVEPWLDIVHAVGDKAHSEALPVVVGDKAVTLRRARSRHSMQGRWLTQEAAPADLEGGLKAPMGAVHRASLIWEARGQESSKPQLDFQEPRDSLGSSCTSPRWTGGVVAPQQGAPEAGGQGPSAPRDISTKVAGAGPWEARHQGLERAVPKPGGGISAAGRVSVQDGPHEPPSWAKDKACDPQARRHPEAKEPLPAAEDGGPQGAEPGVRLRRAHPGDPRGDRWRRRTLPCDTKLDVFHYPPSENTYTGEQRRTDPLSPQAGAFQKPPEACGVTAVASEAPASPGPLGSPMEPRATFFAVTYQIPDIQKAKSTVKSGLENLLEQSRKTAQAASPHVSPSALVSLNQEEPAGPAGRKPSSQDSGGDRALTASSSPKGTDCPLSVGDGVRDRPSDRPLPVGALWIPPGSQDGSASQNAKKDSWSKVTPNTPSAPLRSLSKASGQLCRRRTEVISETFPGKKKDTYRPNVLDLDALMAEYKAKSLEGTIQAQAALPSPMAEAGTSPRERPGQLGPVAPEAQGPRKPTSTDTTMDSPAVGLSKTKMGDPGTPTASKSIPPLWGPPQPVPAPAGSSPWRKAFALPEEGHSTMGTKTQSQPAGTKPCGEEEPGIGVQVSPKPPPAELKTGTPRTPTRWEQGDSVAHCANPLCDPRRPLDVKRACSEKGPPASVREGLAAMQEAMQRRQEQPRARSQARVIPDSQQVSPWDVDHRESGPWESEQTHRKLPPRAAGPWRSQSLCKEQRARPSMDQLKQCFSRQSPEAKDTDTLVQDGPSQDGAWTEPRSSGESLAPESPSPDGSATAGRRQLSHSCFSSPSSPSSPPGLTPEEHSRPRDLRSTEPETTDSPGSSLPPDTCAARPVDHFPFIHQTSVLDSSALKTRVQLSKRTRRRAPTLSHALRSRSSDLGGQVPEEEEADSSWMFKDSTEEKSPQREESDEEESPARAGRTPAFPGMDAAALKARLHKRPEVDSPSETPCWAPRTPKSPFQPRVLGSRVLPSSKDKDGRPEEPSPQWLRELKSKKRQSLCENQA